MAKDTTRGLYEKFIVVRTDGLSEPGNKHDGCRYFVLDVTHDPFAPRALRAYAAACRRDYPALAKDLDRLALEAEADRFLRIVRQGHDTSQNEHSKNSYYEEALRDAEAEYTEMTEATDDYTREMAVAALGLALQELRALLSRLGVVSRAEPDTEEEGTDNGK